MDRRGDPGDETSRASDIASDLATIHDRGYPIDATSGDTPGPLLDLASDLAMIRNRGHAMDMDEVTSHPRRSTEDTEREGKRARLRQTQTMEREPRLRNWPELHRPKLDPSVYQMSEKVVRQARLVAKKLSEKFPRLGKSDIETQEDKKVLSGKTEEVMHPCDSVHFQQAEESKPPCEGYAIPNPESGAHLSELPSQHEQAKLPESFNRSENTPVEYCMSDEFIKLLGRQLRLYYSKVKPLSQKEIIANGFRHMNVEAFLAFNHYIAEKDLFEGFDYKFGELLHHCFSFEGYRKVYCHYNFTIEMKKKDEECWTSSYYFAEAKLIVGVKFYFCSPLEVNAIRARTKASMSSSTRLEEAMRRATKALDPTVGTLIVLMTNTNAFNSSQKGLAGGARKGVCWQT